MRTGGLRRPARGGPFGDVIRSGRAEMAERALAPHPTLKPHVFLRQVVRAILPLGEGVVLDSCAGVGLDTRRGGSERSLADLSGGRQA